jgi:hypothetical protein
VVLACLPDELHGLGLLMVALEVAAAGRTNLVLGPHTPIDEIAATADSLDAVAVGLSLSAFAPTEPAHESVSVLRAELPTKVPLWVGGRGSEALDPLPDGVTRLNTLDDVAEAVRALPD